MKFKYSYLFLSDYYSAIDILPQKNFQRNSLNASIRANTLETLFLDDSFVNQNTLENKNGLFRSALDFYSQETLPSQTTNQEERHCYSENAAIFSFRLSRYSLQACLTPLLS